MRPRSMRALGSIPFLALILAACSATGPAGPTGPDRTGLSPAETPAYAPPPLYQLTAFDSSTLTISATNGFGQSISAAFDAGTLFLRARLIPNDPVSPTCRELAVAYNAALTLGLGDTSIYAAIGGMAVNGCHARIGLDARTSAIRVFFPNDPIRELLPPSPF